MEIKAYNIEEVATLLRVGKPIVYRLVQTGQLQARKVGKAWRITPEAIEVYLAGGKHEEAPR